MEAIGLALIQQLNSSVFVLVGILLFSFWAVYRLGLLVAKFTAQDNKIAALDDLSTKVVVLATKVDLIYQHTLPVNLRPTMSSSPMVITKVGEEIRKAIQADALLMKYLKPMQSLIDLGAPKNAYDIQMAAMKASREFLITLLDANELVVVKNEAFRLGILTEDILSVVGVLLRDHILKEKGIPVSDVDKHATPPR